MLAGKMIDFWHACMRWLADVRYVKPLKKRLAFRWLGLFRSFSDGYIILHTMELYSKYLLLVRVCSKHPLGVRDASARSRVTVVGRPKTFQLDSGREKKNEIRTGFCAERDVRLQFRRKGAHQWFRGGRNGLARGFYYRLAADGRSSSRAILIGAQSPLGATLIHQVLWPIADGPIHVAW